MVSSEDPLPPCGAIPSAAAQNHACRPTADQDAGLHEESPSAADAPSDASIARDSEAASPAGGQAGVVTLERSRCRSAGPAYRVTIAESGAVTFVGEQNVDAMGQSEASIPSGDVNRLVERIRRSGFDRLRNVYHCEPTATRRCSMHPCYSTVRVTVDGATTTVSRSDDAPYTRPALLSIEKDIDTTAGTAKWIGGAGR